MSTPADSAQLFNEIRFERMACGDVEGFVELADEYFTDVRRRMGQWPELLESREFRQLSEDFHRCKGGAAMFGFERLYVLFGQAEVDSEIESGDFHLERFVSEVDAADKAVDSRRAKPSNA